MSCDPPPGSCRAAYRTLPGGAPGCCPLGLLRPDRAAAGSLSSALAPASSQLVACSAWQRGLARQAPTRPSCKALVHPAFQRRPAAFIERCAAFSSSWPWPSRCGHAPAASRARTRGLDCTPAPARACIRLCDGPERMGRRPLAQRPPPARPARPPATSRSPPAPRLAGYAALRRAPPCGSRPSCGCG